MMTWIKNHPAQTAAVALSISLAASTVELYQAHSTSVRSLDNRSGFPAAASAFVAPKSESAFLDTALHAAQSPGIWKVNSPTAPRLFASEPYVAINGKLLRPAGQTFYRPVPNDWLIEHSLDVLNSNILREDPDKDGFTTLQEWEGIDGLSHLSDAGEHVTRNGRPLPKDSTNPVDPNSHPPYYTRLALERVEQIPFHLKFLGHDAHGKNPGKVTVQINATPGRTEFVEVGKSLEHAPVHVRAFERKEAPGPDGTTKDVSEVVVVDRRTGQEVTLPKGQEVNSPESYAILRFDWTQPDAAASAREPLRFRLRKNDTFQLPPEPQVYRVAAIRADAVDVILASGELHSVFAHGPAQK
jgi:hypothetical protein